MGSGIVLEISVGYADVWDPRWLWLPQTLIVVNRLWCLWGELFFFKTIVFTDFLMTGSFQKRPKTALLSGEDSLGDCLSDGDSRSDFHSRTFEGSSTRDLEMMSHAAPYRLGRDNMPYMATRAQGGGILLSVRQDVNIAHLNPRYGERERDTDGEESVNALEADLDDISLRREDGVDRRERGRERETRRRREATGEIHVSEEQLQDLMHSRRRFNALYCLYWVLLSVFNLGRFLYVAVLNKEIRETQTFH
ncbi:hypothetical protein KIPB_010504, partial [Kipferlia bialata]|eukprot:g10504.t1